MEDPKDKLDPQAIKHEGENELSEEDLETISGGTLADATHTKIFGDMK